MDEGGVKKARIVIGGLIVLVPPVTLARAKAWASQHTSAVVKVWAEADVSNYIIDK